MAGDQAEKSRCSSATVLTQATHMEESNADADIAESWWHPDPSLLDQSFLGPQVTLVLTAFRRRHFSRSFSRLLEDDRLSSAAFKQELWNILSGTQEPSEEFVRKLAHGQGRKSAICGKIWGKSDLAYRCLDCGTGPCSAVCAECFINGDHKNHNYVMYQSSAGGCCDCGDADAWLPSGNCCFHNDSDSRLLQSLPSSASARLYTVVSSVLWVHCASISFGNYPFVDDAIEWLLSVAESCDVLRELVGDAFIQRLPPGDSESQDITCAARCIEALVSLISCSLQVSLPIPVSFFALQRHVCHPVIPNVGTPEFFLSIEERLGSHSLFASFINTHLFCLENSNKLLLTIVLLPAVKNIFGESFVCRYHTMIQIIVQQPSRSGNLENEFLANLASNMDNEFCTNLQDQLVDLSVQLLSNARIVQHLVTQCSYFTVLFSSLLESLNRAVVPNDRVSAFVLPGIACVVKSLAVPPACDVQFHELSNVSANMPDVRSAEVIAILNRIAEIQSGFHVDIPSSYVACRLQSPQNAFFIPLNIGAKMENPAFSLETAALSPAGHRGMTGGRAVSRELSLYIRELNDRTAVLQRNFGGISRFPLTGGFPIPGTLQVDHVITDTGPDKKRLHVITSDLANVFFHHDAVAAFLEDADSFDMFLNVAKLMQFADGQLMFVHRHIENVADDKWIRGLNCEREHYLIIMAHFTSALAPGNVSVPSFVDRGQPQASSSLAAERRISILHSCLRRSVIFLLQFLTAGIQQNATFAIPMWLKHNNQLLEHFDRSQFVTCCIFQPVSFHLPLHRTLSYFLALLSVHMQTINAHSPIRELLNPSFAALALQHPLSLLTAVCQARLNMWVRNGNMMHHRSWFYMHNFFRDQFINSDGFLLQASCAFIDPDALWTRVLASFGFAFTDRIEVLQASALWFFTEQSATAPALFEGFLMLMLSLLSGSWSPALVVGFSDSECDISRIRTEICCLLSIKDKTYSELQNLLPRAVSSHPSFDAVLESSTTFTPPSSRTLKEGSFRLLPSVYEHHFSAVRVYFSAFRLGDVEAAVSNWSSQFNLPSSKVDPSDAKPRAVRFVCPIDDPISSNFYPMTFCDTFWQTLRCLSFSLCSSFHQQHSTNTLHLPAAFAMAAVDAALRSGREEEVYLRMNEPVATFSWQLSPDHNRELVTGGSTPVVTSIYDSLHAIKDIAESHKSQFCLAQAYNYALYSIEKLIAAGSESNGAAVRSRESDPAICRKKSTAMAARQHALARIRLLQQQFSCSCDDKATASPSHVAADIQMQTSSVAIGLEERGVEDTPCASPSQNLGTGETPASWSSAALQSPFGMEDVTPKCQDEISCADDLGCCCICTMEADYNDPLGLLVSMNPDPLGGSSRIFLSSLSPSDELMAEVDTHTSVLIQSCGHAVHVSCMQSWLLMHQGPSSQFSDGFPCPLCRSQRNGVLPFVPHSHDAVIENVLSTFPIRLRERQPSSTDVVSRAVAAFRSAADDEGNTAFEEARESFLQTCENVVFDKDWNSEPGQPCVVALSARLLHGHARVFRSCLPYAESHRANALVFCLLRRLNAYQISKVLSSSHEFDARCSAPDNSGLMSVLNYSEHVCLRSIIIAATMNFEQPESALLETSPLPSPVHSPQHSLGKLSIGSSPSLSQLSPSVTERCEEFTKMTSRTSVRSLSTMEGVLMSSVSITGVHLLTCNSHIVATLVATILPSNAHAKCLTAAMLLLHVVAGFCPHLFKPPSMSQPLGMIELANRTILAVISSGSHGAILLRLLPLTDALHDDQKLLLSKLISHTMQFVCDIFLMKMVDFVALVPQCADHVNCCLKIWAGLLCSAVTEESPCSIARFNVHNGFSPLPEFRSLPSTFQEFVWEHRRSNCCICSESSMRKKELCVCLFCGAVICCNVASGASSLDTLNLDRCFFMHASSCCGPPAFGVAVCIGDSNAYLFQSGRRVVSWGSLYLDKHGRADPTMRRIQGLTLSIQRLHLLRSQLLLRSLSDNTGQ